MACRFRLAPIALGLSLLAGWIAPSLAHAGTADPSAPAREPGADEAAPIPVLAGTAGAERFAVAVADGALVERWHAVRQGIAAERAVLARCRVEPRDCPPAAHQFLAVTEAARAREGRARLGEINRAINLALRPVSDRAQHGVPDAWATPLESFAGGAGDCEDYAIAKYAALREAGLADDDLRLLLVRDRMLRLDHAVLAARLDGHWLILDNRRFALVDAEYLTQYQPLFALDATGVRRLDWPLLATLSMR